MQIPEPSHLRCIGRANSHARVWEEFQKSTAQYNGVDQSEGSSERSTSRSYFSGRGMNILVTMKGQNRVEGPRHSEQKLVGNDSVHQTPILGRTPRPGSFPFHSLWDAMANMRIALWLEHSSEIRLFPDLAKDVTSSCVNHWETLLCHKEIRGKFKQDKQEL